MSGKATPADLSAAQSWFEAAFGAPSSGLPLSLACAGKPLSELLSAWRAGWEDEPAEGGATARRLTLRDPAGGLEIRCEVSLFDAFPAVEWVAHLQNAADADSPLLSEILPLDALFSLNPEHSCTLHHAKGSDCKLDDFMPLETPLPVGAQVELAPQAGRSSDGTLPFFNLDFGGRGVIVAVGWTGGWRATFTRTEAGLRVQAGMKRTHLKLLPGEAIRTPRVLLLFWEGERLHGHNMLRQFILAHHTPRPGGELLQAPICNAVWGENHVANQIAKARWLKDHGIPLDVFWIDAGWHGDGEFLEGSTVFNSQWGAHVGNWWPNKTTYPQGLGPVGDALRQMGFGFCLWFEPERVFRGTYFTREHPDWLLGPMGDNSLYNLGHVQARQALTDLISDLITESGITVYRQDFNFDPAPYWEAADAPDRVGISEIRHIEGLYAMWDELRARHPDLIIDNCSSGGRRIDLETISRSIPLWRSDYQCWPDFDVIGQQSQTHGLGLWVPLSTGCCERPDTYAFRSALGPGIVFSSNVFESLPSDHFPADWLRQAATEQRNLRRFFYGDFYPLTAWSVADDVWAAWQFDRPDLGEGMVLALRRPKSPYSRLEANLSGLEPQARYEVTGVDEGSCVEASGEELITEGLGISIAEKPGSALLLYRRV